MNYKLKSVNGKVTFLLRTGKDLVKNQMAVASAQHIIDHCGGLPHQYQQRVVLRGRGLQAHHSQED